MCRLKKFQEDSKHINTLMGYKYLPITAVFVIQLDGTKFCISCLCLFLNGPLWSVTVDAIAVST